MVDRWWLERIDDTLVAAEEKALEVGLFVLLHEELSQQGRIVACRDLLTVEVAAEKATNKGCGEHPCQSGQVLGPLCDHGVRRERVCEHRRGHAVFLGGDEVLGQVTTQARTDDRVPIDILGGDDPAERYVQRTFPTNVSR
ncbi:MAG: hypothetical protein ACC683_13055 [Acidimicrobiia bacterium]